MALAGLSMVKFITQLGQTVIITIIIFHYLIFFNFILFFMSKSTYKTFLYILTEYLKSSDAKASKCHLKISSLIMIFIKLVYLSSVISLKWQ